jgi:predicted esterase
MPLIMKKACFAAFLCLSLAIYQPTIAQTDDVKALVTLLKNLSAKEKNPLLKRHFESLATITLDKSQGEPFTAEDSAAASAVLEFMQGDGAKWETYVNGPRPLVMGFVSPADKKNSYYLLFLPKNFDNKKKDYPLYVELHGSGGGANNDPRQMLYYCLQPEVKGVTHQGYRKEGLFIYPWGRGDKGYRDIAETDIYECLADFDKQFKTDPKRQFLYGFSMGGGGTYRILLGSLDRWSAIGIYSGAVRDPSLEDAKKIVDKGIPVWMVWGEKERLRDVNVKLKDLFIAAGADIKWHEVEGVEHNYLGEYQEDLMDWFLAHPKK